MADTGRYLEIKVEQLVLDLANYRHEKVRRPAEAIEYLVTKERVVELAEDIAEEGSTNPMDLMGVVKKGGSKQGQEVYVAVEGNRRVCALLLLNDPEKLPTSVPNRKKLVKRLERASARGNLPSRMMVCVFKSKKSGKPWIDRLHLPQGHGRKRRDWNPDQQDRAMGGGRNKEAVQLLDVAQSAGFITKEDRDKKITTVQRYLGNRTMRAVLGLARNKQKKLDVVRPKEDFQALFERFLADIRDGELSSRSNAAAVEKYALDLQNSVGIGETIIDPKPLTEVSVKRRTEEEEGDDKPVKKGEEDSPPAPPPSKRKSIKATPKLSHAFNESGSQKLISLYNSCVQLDLNRHCPLITVGIWSILETLSTLYAGKPVQFVNYLSSDRLTKEFGFPKGNERKDIRAAIDAISHLGNSTKHSAISGSFDGQQIANHFDVLEPLMIAILGKIN